ncbi:hypothetical protein ABKN59_005144 [Abortiporus biennis]
MGSLFRQIFCCCIRSSSPGPHEPDETTNLIRPEDSVPQTPSYVVDTQKMKERLGTIVRAKEGKMVNVNAPLPFNLHNKSLYAQLEESSSRSERSLSVENNGVSDTVGRARLPSYSPTRGGRDLSPSLQTSRSTTSLHPGDASYLPPEADPDNGNRGPILNVRLVNVGGSGSSGRVGRSITRGRRGRYSFERPSNLAMAHLENESSDIKSFSKLPDATPRAHPCSDASSQETRPEADTLGQDTPLAMEFKIQGVGKISQSWGD